MFRKAIFSYTFVSMGLLAVWIFSSLHVTAQDLMRFRNLQKKGQAIAAASHQRISEQKRAGVRKDLWITQPDGKRLHDRIESQSSILKLAPVDDHLDIIEHLNNIQCSMQDKIVKAQEKWIQQVRYFEAQTGIYQYSTNQFTAEVVSLALFRVAGEELPPALKLSSAHLTPYLKGVAQDVSFAVSGKASQFQAKHFKASFIGQKDD